MRISKILINHMTEPIGFQLDDLRIEFTVEAEQFTEITKQLTIWTIMKPPFTKASRNHLKLTILMFR